MIIHFWQILTTFIVFFGASLFSGMAGGGGGFIVLPVLIAMGLSPQQAVATGKLGAFGLSTGAVTAFRGKSFENRKLLVYMMCLAVAVSLFVPHVFREINGKTFQLILGAMLLALTPLVLFEKQRLQQKQPSRFQMTIGSILVVVVLFLQGVFSGGMGALNNVLLIYFFGLTALQANAMRRLITMSLNTFVVIALMATTHFVVYKLAAAGLVGGFIGGYIGSRIALEKGERFAQMALAIFMIISGLYLVITA
jgi:uncharacterized membrane protein YfcA